MKKLFLFAFIAAIMASGCRKYDDSNLRNRVGDLENRVTKLEELCGQLNTNIASLHTLVAVLQNNDCITAVIPIVNNGKTIGYTITFTKSNPITIYHGTDGMDGVAGKDGEDGINGYTPQIGVKQDADGTYYWTVDGDWLTDEVGNKIKASATDGKDGKDGQDGSSSSGPVQNGKDGQDGKDGVTPRLKIEDDYWFVSYDDGVSWAKLGKATGDNGKDGQNGKDGLDGGDSIFSNVQETDTEVIFTLANGTEIRISKNNQQSVLDITFSNTDSINALPNNTYEITYTIIGANESTIIDVIAQNYYKAYIEAEDYASGKIIVTTPSADLEDSRVLVFVSRGNETIMRILNFVESVIIVSTETIEVDADGGTETVDIETNINYIVDIPESDHSWISVAETRAATHIEKLTFTILANPNTTYRYSTITLKDEKGYAGPNILFVQKASGNKTIHVETAGTLKQVIAELSIDETILEEATITGHLNMTDYEYIKTWSNLKFLDIAGLEDGSIPDSCFKESEIETIILPVNLTAIPAYAFYQSKITSINIPGTVTSIDQYAFAYCTNLKGDLIIPDNTRFIYRYAFYGCSGLAGSNLVIGENIVTIYPYAFISEFYNPIPFSKVYIKKTSNTSIFIYDESDSISRIYPFGRYTSGYWNATLDYLGVPVGCKALYKDSGYSVFKTIDEVEF